MPFAEVAVYDSKKHESGSHNTTVDQRLVELAKDLNGRIVTSDFNLNKVAGVQGVEVINLNDVAKIGWGSGQKPEYVFNRRWFVRPELELPNPFGGTTDQVAMRFWRCGINLSHRA